MVRQTSMGVVLMVASAGSSALSLGAIQGRAIIGRSLELRVPIHLASDDSLANLCASAKVHYGELAVPGANVTVGVETAKADAKADKGSLIKILSAPVVNEPFVTIDLTVGCSAALLRSYVVLADPASMSTDQAVFTVVPASAPVAMKAQAAIDPGVSDIPGPPSRAIPKPVQVAQAAPKPKKVQPSPIPPSKPKATVAMRAPLEAAPRMAGSRLTLDPLELVASEERAAPVLRLSSDGFGSPAEGDIPTDLQAKRDAARALWQALNSSPEQAAGLLTKGSVADSEAAKLRTQLAAAQASEAAARVQLQDEQENRWTQPVVLGLALALLLTFGAMVWLWSRRLSQRHAGQAQPWWKRQTADVGGLLRGDDAEGPESGSRLTKSAQVDIDVDTLFPPETFRHSEPRASTWAPSERGRLHGGSDFLPSTLLDGARSVATEELFDLQQQVEFFISLGQADQAVDVLVNHIADSHEPSPLAYLDLLKLYHELGRKDDYEQLRQSFNEQFNGGAPEFDHYSQSRRGLERYELALGRIQAEWPRRGVLQVIERAIFRHDTDEPVEVFDLEAYRELLLLYGIAREVIDWNEDAGGHFPQPQSEPSASVSANPESHQTPYSGSPVGTFLGAGDSLVEPVRHAEHGDQDAATTRTDVASAPASTLDFDLSSVSDNNLNLSNHTTHVGADAERVGTDDASVSLSMVPPDGPSWTGALGNGAATDLHATGQSSAPGRDAPVIDFDFSDFGEPEAFTIKKSGKTE